MNNEKFETKLFISESNKRKMKGFTWKRHVASVILYSLTYSYSLRTNCHSLPKSEP